MAHTTQADDVHDDPKQALSAYILELEHDFCPWYETAVKRNYFFWSISQGTAILAGLITALIAGVSSPDSLKTHSWLRFLLILTPLVGTFASTLMLQTRIRELFALRERGRQDIQSIAASARVEFAATDEKTRFTEIHRDLIKRVSRVETEQTVGFFTIVPDLAGHEQTKGDAS